MGLLDRWTKKKQKEKLEESAKPEAKAEVKSEAKAEKKAETAAVKKKALKVKEEKTITAVKAKVSAVADKVLVGPLVTEKAAIMAGNNQYGFIVSLNATKLQIKKAVADVYGVAPVAVNIINVQGKQVRFGRSMGRRSDYKKALVTLPAGKTINVHEGV